MWSGNYLESKLLFNLGQEYEMDLRARTGLAKTSIWLTPYLKKICGGEHKF